MANATNSEYLALARKYRPQNFKDVVGQVHVLNALANTIDAKRIHHAYLLTGTRGIGKTTIARIMAKSLQCRQGVSSSPCGECDACKAIAAGSFPDVIEIDAASQTKVDDTRALLENTQYPPLSGRYKIYIIDEVHMLSQSSFNALLKTLEEPPSYVKFILATTDPQKIPATVLSRCLQFQLKALSIDEIKNQIIKILAQEGLKEDAEAANLIARAARGSMRDALSLCDQAIALGNGMLDKGSVIAMLGTASDEMLCSVLDLLVAPDMQALPAVMASIGSTSPNYKNLIDELSLLLHDIALFQFIGGAKLELFTFPRQMIERYAGSLRPETVQLYYQIVIEGLNEIKLSADNKTSFEMTLLRLLAFTPEKKNFGQGR